MNNGIKRLLNEENVNKINRIRSKPEMHFKYGKPNAEELISGLLEEGVIEVNELVKVAFIQGW